MRVLPFDIFSHANSSMNISISVERDVTTFLRSYTFKMKHLYWSYDRSHATKMLIKIVNDHTVQFSKNIGFIVMMQNRYSLFKSIEAV